VSGPGAFEGEGWDHVAWRVERSDGAWIVKQVKEGPAAERAASVAREAAVMRFVAQRLGEGWVAADPSAFEDRLTYRRVPGEPLVELIAAGRVGEADRARLADELGRVIRAVGTLDPSEIGLVVPVDDDGWDQWFDGWDAYVEAVAPQLDPATLDAVRRFAGLARPPRVPVDRLVFAHNDLAAEHVLVDPASLSIIGIIDWTDAAMADPAAEVGRLWRDLGAEALPAVLGGLGVDGAERAALVERAGWYARLLAVEDLAYAVAHRPHLVPFERATVIRLFADLHG
jgi:aminoglycoside phosphotransferase (APT) family kinase protein